MDQARTGVIARTAAGGRAVKILILFVAMVAGSFVPRAHADLKPVVPLVAPELRVEDLQGKTHSLDAYRGQVVLVNFWASWCPPCRKEMPSMQRLTERMGDAPFVILAVASGEPREDVEAFLATMKLTFPILIEQNAATMRAWKVYTLPSSFLLDRQGRIRYVLSGGMEWDDAEAVGIMNRLIKE